MKSFAEVLKELRKANGLTQDELSVALNMSRSRISMYEVGAREPDFEILESIADYFNVDMDFLLGRSQKTTTISNADNVVLSSDEGTLLRTFRKLNDDGKTFALTSVEMLTKMDQYKK